MENDFQPRSKKQAQEFIFSQKLKAILHPPLQTTSPKTSWYLIILNTRLSFEKHLETVLCKINKTIGLICKLQNLLPRTVLVTLCKAFICPHLDYSDIHDQAHNALFHQKLQSLQYNAGVAIAGAIHSSSREKLYQELGFEFLQQCCWYK